MLSKDDILKKRADFQLIKEKGRLYQSPLFGLLVLKKRADRKIGFLISKKVSKRAVDRNRIRRLLAESVRVNLKNMKNEVWVVFLVKKRMLGMKFEETEKEVGKMMKIVGII